MNNQQKIGLAAIAVSILCLVATFVVSAPVWVNILGLAAGFGGLILLTRKKKDGGA